MAARPRATLPGEDREGFELEADLIRVLANSKRLMMVDLLGRGAKTVTEIADRLCMSLPNASQHLRVMKDRGIVRAHRDGREVRYALVSPVISESCQLVRRALLSEVRARSTRIAWRRASTAEIRAARGPEGSRPRPPIPVPS
jgi:DNA-binding transcriptional ArsR family regulator